MLSYYVQKMILSGDVIFAEVIVLHVYTAFITIFFFFLLVPNNLVD